jgi:hypothetical protein
MLRTTLIAALAAASILGVASAANAGQDFTLHNDSGRDIHQLFISPDTSDNWGNEMLAGQILPSGGSADVELNSFGNHCVFDILVADRDGDTQEMYGVDLCYYSGVEIN